MESSSYERILSNLSSSSRQAVFLTDIIKGEHQLFYLFQVDVNFGLYFKEADAAQQAGVQVCLLRRADNPDKETKSYKWVPTFDEIELR